MRNVLKEVELIFSFWHTFREGYISRDELLGATAFMGTRMKRYCIKYQHNPDKEGNRSQQSKERRFIAALAGSLQFLRIRVCSRRKIFSMKMTSTNEINQVKRIEGDLLTLNYRLALRGANAWRGITSHAAEHSLYDGFQEILNADTIQKTLDLNLPRQVKHRIFHSLLGHYLQYRSLPFENELSMWMRGASADVEGEKIYFKDIIAWCQKRSDLAKRRIMEKETISLSRFLKPFALSPWEFVLELLREEFGYKDYVTFCSNKKEIDYSAYITKLERLLTQTEELYFASMEDWTRADLGTSLSELNRFDGIYLLGLGKLNGLFPSHIPLSKHLRFFDHWQMPPDKLPGLHLDMEYSPRKGSQAMSFAARIPDEVYLVMNPQGGWIDLETLFHEMGHALSNIFTSRELSPVEKDFHPSNTLSETYAFLLQNMIFTPLFLERELKLKPKDIDKMIYYKTLKDMSFFRRYAAKFLAEHEMFKTGSLSDGEIYATLLKKYTGFSYRSESHLFDLVPEFYALDYVISWMAEAVLEKNLVETLGANWMYRHEAGDTLRNWWLPGNRFELEEFFKTYGLGTIDPGEILKRWQSRLSLKGAGSQTM